MNAKLTRNKRTKKLTLSLQMNDYEAHLITSLLSTWKVKTQGKVLGVDTSVVQNACEKIGFYPMERKAWGFYSPKE
jgi:hypothetical protein